MTTDTHLLDTEVRLRPATMADAASLADSLTRSRAYLQPWEPVRPDAFYTEKGQQERLAGLLADHEAGRVMPWVLADADDRAMGGFTLTNIVLGPFRSASLGYWVDVAYMRPGPCHRSRDAGLRGGQGRAAAAPGGGLDLARQRGVAAGARQVRLRGDRYGSALSAHQR